MHPLEIRLNLPLIVLLLIVTDMHPYRISGTVGLARAIKIRFPAGSYRRLEKRYWRPVQLRAQRWWVDARERFTRGAAIDSPPAQHSLRKQPAWPTAQASGNGRRRPLVVLQKRVQRIRNHIRRCDATHHVNTTVAIGNPERHMRKASHRGSKP